MNERYSGDSSKLLSRNLSQLKLTEVSCFKSTGDRAQHCFKNEWTLACIAQFALCSVYTRCLMVSIDQVDPRYFYFRISWILMEWCWFYFFRPLHLMQSLEASKIDWFKNQVWKSFTQNIDSSSITRILVP